ncbi:MAG: hypothetical protein WAK17_15230 [Candidatus Nitrosopolaris sp.]|jgi:hypothetical protein
MEAFDEEYFGPPTLAFKAASMTPEFHWVSYQVPTSSNILLPRTSYFLFAVLPMHFPVYPSSDHQRKPKPFGGYGDYGDYGGYPPCGGYCSYADYKSNVITYGDCFGY